MRQLLQVNGYINGYLTVLQVRAWFQKEDPSSKLNNTPPMGAPKAAATPAAAPLDTKSRLSLHVCHMSDIWL